MKRSAVPTHKDTMLRVSSPGVLTEEDLSSAFSNFGKIMGIQNHPQFGWIIEFTDHRDTKDAKAKMDGTLIGDNKISVSFHKWQVFFAQLSFDADEIDVAEFFKPYGVKAVRLQSHGDSGRHRGCGFVDVESELAQKDCIREMNGKEIMGRAIKVSHVSERSDRTEKTLYAPVENKRLMVQNKLARVREENPTRCICLKNMVTPDQVDKLLEEEVSVECSKYGVVEKLVIYQQSEKDQVVVKIFVMFKTPDMATFAQDKLHKRYFDGRTIDCTFYPEEEFVKRNYEHV